MYLEKILERTVEKATRKQLKCKKRGAEGAPWTTGKANKWVTDHIKLELAVDIKMFKHRLLHFCLFMRRQ